MSKKKNNAENISSAGAKTHNSQVKQTPKYTET